MNKIQEYLLAKRKAGSSLAKRSEQAEPLVRLPQRELSKPAVEFSAEERALRDEKCLLIKMVYEAMERNRWGLGRASGEVAALHRDLFPRLAANGQLAKAYNNIRNWVSPRYMGKTADGKPNFENRNALLRNYGHEQSDEDRYGDPRFWKKLMGMYLNNQAVELAKLYRIVADEWTKDLPDQKIPSLARVHYYIRRKFPKRMLSLARKGDTYYAQHHRDYIERDPESIRPNEAWVADNRELDFMIRTPDGAGGFKAVRPWACVILDVKSEHVVSCQLSAEPVNNAMIRNGLGDAIFKFGRPQIFYSDNGKDYAARGFTTPVIFTPNIADSEVYVHCIMKELDIQVQFGEAYNAQTKVVERFNREMAAYDRFCRGYVGNKPENRPATAEVWSGNPEHLMNMDGACKWMDDFLKIYHSKPSPESKYLKGLSPSQAFDPSLRLNRPQLSIAEYYMAFLMPLSKPRIVESRGPSIRCGKRRYVAVDPKAMWMHDGKPVMVKFDNDNPEHCFTFELSGKFICECRTPLWVSYFARTGAEKQLLSDERRRIKSERKELNTMIMAATGGFHKLDPMTVLSLPPEAFDDNARLRLLDSRTSVKGDTHNPKIYVLPGEINDRPVGSEPMPDDTDTPKGKRLEFGHDDVSPEDLAKMHARITRKTKVDGVSSTDVARLGEIITRNRREENYGNN